MNLTSENLIMSSTSLHESEYDLLSPFSKGSACDFCHSKKIRCDKRRPHCNECTKRKIQCNYGTRLKRGPKMAKLKAAKPQEASSQLQNIPKSNAHLQAMLFELQFNKKMAELWKNMYNQIGAGELRPPPKFSPATEEFVRAPQAALNLMEDFNSTYRLIYTLPNFAPSLDFAIKVWQILIDVNLTDLLTIINSFETSMLLPVLEYIVIFQLCTKIYLLDDISAYLNHIVQHIINLIVYARDGTSDILTPELTLQLMPSITLISSYFKMALNKPALTTYHYLLQSLYDQNKSSPLFSKEIEARMLCRKVLSCSTKESANECLQRLDELDKEGIMSPNLHFHLNIHLSFYRLCTTNDVEQATKAAHKAEYYIDWHLNQIPPERREMLKCFYTTRMNAVHMEILMRLGNTESAFRRIGEMFDAFGRLPASYRRLCVANCRFFLATTCRKQNFLCRDYVELLIDPSALVNHTLFPNFVFSTQHQAIAFQQSWKSAQSSMSAQKSEESASNEALENVESSTSSPLSDTLTLEVDFETLNAAYDESSLNEVIDFIDEYFVEDTGLGNPFQFTSIE